MYRKMTRDELHAEMRSMERFLDGKGVPLPGSMTHAEVEAELEKVLDEIERRVFNE